ncbi:MAG: DUF1559 domain-containing protein [Planctomycetaceae bacterium]
MAENPYTPQQEVRTPQAVPRVGRDGVIAAVLIAIFAAPLFLSVFSRGSSQRAAHETSCRRNCRQIALAIQSYHDQYQAFPPAYTVDADGKPLHSWRTLILPYLNEQALYDSIDLAKPWDDEINIHAWKSIPQVYRCSVHQHADNRTTYLAVVASGSCLQPRESATSSDITDGASKTVLMIDVSEDQGVIWMSPKDASLDQFLTMGTKLSPSHRSANLFTFCDATVNQFPRDYSVEYRKAMVSIAGNDRWE